MRGGARLATYLGRVMIAAGLVVILLGWNFAAGLDCVQCQFPYLLSAGVSGLALVIVGMSLEFVQTQRELTARRAKEAAQLDASLSRLVGFVRDGALGRRDDDSDVTLPPVEHNWAALDSSGHVFDPPTAAMPAVAAATAVAPAPSAQGAVVAGRSSFHDPACRLVTNREDMRMMSREQAEGAGLAPCRICKP